MKVVWSDDLSVANEKIDEQHRQLFTLINDLASEKRFLRGASLENAIDALTAYLQIHFQTEEEYFSRYDYPDAQDHEREHSEFVSKTIEFRQQFNAGKLIHSDEIAEFLTDWLFRHIMLSDMKFKGLFPE